MMMAQGFVRFVCRQLHTSSPVLKRPGIIYPHKLSFMWRYEQEMNREEYTVDALKKIRTGGRGPDGIVQYKHVGGGLQRPIYLVDYIRSRQMQTRKVEEELVLKVFKSFYRHPYVALVASGNTKRWIVATENMKPGDIIRGHFDIPKIPIDPRSGDAHPIGALPVGTKICLFELEPGAGGLISRSAGCNATLVKRGARVGTDESIFASGNYPCPSTLGRDDLISEEELCIVYESGRRQEYRLLPNCVAVVGQVSNVNHENERYASIQEKLNDGIRQRSGLKQKKTGRFGRKTNRTPPESLNEAAGHQPLDQLLYLHCMPGTPELNQAKMEQRFLQQNRMIHAKIQPTPSPFNQESEHKQPHFNWASWQKIR